MTMQEFRECPEVVWLQNFQQQVDFETMAVEELTKSQEIYQVFFSDDTPGASAAPTNG